MPKDFMPPRPSDIEEMSPAGGNCPVQSYGAWRGREIYFRARGDVWSLGVAPGAAGEEAFHASAPLGNSGWMGSAEADELIHMHLWSWSWRERGLEESGGPAGLLAKALRLLDVDLAKQALAGGADSRVPLEKNGPLPLCMALALSDEASESPVAVGSEALVGLSMAAWDVAREGKRQAMARALLAAGASPDDSGPGWRMRPVHWAALIPSGQPTMEAGYAASWGAQAQSLATKERSLEAERALANPWFDLADARADLSAPFPTWTPGAAIDADCLDLALGGGACALGEAMAKRMAPLCGDEPMRRVASNLLDMAGLDIMSGQMGISGRDAPDPYQGAAFQKALSEFGSGQWPLAWLGDLDLRREEAKDAASHLRGLLVSRIESGELEKQTPHAEEEARPRRAAPLGRI